MTHTECPKRRLSPTLCRVLVLLSMGFCGGCATLGGKSPGESLVPNRCETRTGPFAVYTNTSLAVDSQAVRCLGALERDVAQNLGIRSPESAPPVEIYILRDRETFAHFLRFYYPELPPRRAFFLAQGDKSVVYAFFNERLEEDLRHEATHALLHAAVGELPLWLDEGLAEYLETPHDRLGHNAEHVAKLPADIKDGWKPDLPRLESLKTVREMTPLDYREAWAWVHYLLNGNPSGKAELLAFLGELRATPEAAPLSARLAKVDKDAASNVLAHFEQVRTSPATITRPNAAARSDATILLQNSGLDPAPTSSPLPSTRKGFFGRMFSIFGGGD